MPRSSAPLRVIAAAAAATAALAAAGAVPAGAVGYAGTPPVPAPVGSFPSTAVSGSTSSNAPLTLTNNVVTLNVPAGVLPAGTQVTVLNGDAGHLQSLLPAGNGYVAGFAVGWIAPDGSSPDATAPLTFTINDTRITGTESAFETTQTGLTASNAKVTPGHATFSFTKDPGFVLASAVTTPIGPGNTGGGAAASADGSTWSPTPPAIAIAAGMGLIALLGGLVRRRRLPAATR
jgi:hypothetical protein